MLFYCRTSQRRVTQSLCRFHQPLPPLFPPLFPLLSQLAPPLSPPLFPPLLGMKPFLYTLFLVAYLIYFLKSDNFPQMGLFTTLGAILSPDAL